MGILLIKEQFTSVALRLLLAYPFKDAKKFVSSCDAFHRMGKPVHNNEMPLQTLVLIEPFEKWALYFIRPISLMSRTKRYILVFTNYVTKWVEAKDLYATSENFVVDFLFEDIFPILIYLEKLSPIRGPNLLPRW